MPWRKGANSTSTPSSGVMLSVPGRISFRRFASTAAPAVAVWLDPGELEALAPEAHTSWLGELLSRMTGRGEDRR